MFDKISPSDNEIKQSKMVSSSCENPACRQAIESSSRQSPINIQQACVKYQEYRPFQFHGHEKLSVAQGTLRVENTGGTLKLFGKPEAAFVNGGPLNVPYEFVEMHFHWGDVNNEQVEGSEHTIDGHKFALELHMVHKNIHDKTIEDALGHENGLCVLAFVFKVVPEEIGSEIKTQGLDALATIAVRHLTKSGSVFENKSEKEVDPSLDAAVANFIPFMVDEYFTYRGSLTTGDCEEAVNWVLFKTPLAVRTWHLKSFQQLQNSNCSSIVNNYRPTMPDNGRPIYYHGDDLLDRMDFLSLGKTVGLRSKEPATIYPTILPRPMSGPRLREDLYHSAKKGIL